jgi:WD40 repeat protein
MAEPEEYARAVWQRLRGSVYDGDSSGDWATTERYLRRHAAKHARDAGALDELLTDVEFLVHADAPLLAAQLPTVEMTGHPPGSGPSSHAVPGASDSRAIFRASFASHRDADSEARRHILMVDAARLGRMDLSERLSRRDSWAVRWSTSSGQTAAIRQCLVRTAVPARTGARHNGPAPPVSPGAAITVPVTAIAAAWLDGRPHLVAAYSAPGAYNVIVAWDIITGSAAAELRDEGVAAEVTSVVAIALGTRVLVAAGHSSGQISAWDLRSQILEYRIDAHTANQDETERSVLALTVGGAGDDPCLISAGQDGTVRVWAAQDGAHRRDFTRQHGAEAHLGAVRTVAALRGTGTAGEQAVNRTARDDIVLTGGDDGMLRTWNLADGALMREWRAHRSGVNALSVAGEWRGDLLAVSGDTEGNVAGWDPVSGEQLIPARRIGSAGITAVVLHGRAYSLTGDHDGMVRRWDLQEQRSSRVLAAQSEGWISVVIMRIEDRPYAISGGSDGAVRIWDLNAEQLRGLRSGDSSRVVAVQAVPGEAGGYAVSAGLDGCVMVRDLAAGDRHALQPARWELRRPRLLAVTLTGRRQPLLVCAGNDAVAVYGPGAGQQCPLPVTARQVVCAAVTMIGEVALIALGLALPAPAIELFTVAGAESRRLGTLEVPDPGDPVTVVAAALTPGSEDAQKPPGPCVLAAVHWSGTAQVWEIELPASAPRLTVTLETGCTGITSAGLGFVAEHLMLALGTADRTVELWDLTRRQPRNLLHCAEPVPAVGVDPAGGIVLSQGCDVIALRSRM